MLEGYIGKEYLLSEMNTIFREYFVFYYFRDAAAERNGIATVVLVTDNESDLTQPIREFKQTRSEICSLFEGSSSPIGGRRAYRRKSSV